MECLRLCRFLLGVCARAKSETPETIIKSLPLHQKRLNIFEGLSVCLVALPVRTAWNI
ncbi:MAG: hypothetical protein LBC64_07525 [Fibromonadaceae bacterium]|nr:hypothetical protein [Fibromonadaceae bacterium]